MAAGYIGVGLFFVLSGFLITNILLNTTESPHYFRTFYARRSLRIFPLYYGVLLVLLLLTIPMHLTWGGWFPYLLTYTANCRFWLANQLIPLSPFNINHFWSLQVEEQFYLVWPLVVYKVRRPLRLVRICVSLSAVILVVRICEVALRPRLANIYLPYSTTFSCADFLLLGSGLAALMRTNARTYVLRFAPWVFLGCSATLLALSIHYDGLEWQTNMIIPTIGFTIMAFLWASTIALAITPQSLAESFFSNGLLRKFGKYSYGLYVYHYSLAGMVGSPIRIFAGHYFHSKLIGVGAGALVTLVASILCAVLSYRLYEVHFMKLKRYFSY